MYHRAWREESVQRYVNARVEEYRIGTPDIITGPIFHVQQCSARRIHLSLLTVFTLGGNALQETRGIFRLDTRRWVIYNARRKVSTRGSIVSRLQSAALPIVIARSADSTKSADNLRRSEYRARRTDSTTCLVFLAALHFALTFPSLWNRDNVNV